MLPVLLAAAVLSGCPAPVVRPPPPPAPEKPAPAPPQKPVVRPPLRVEYPQQIALLLPLSGHQQAAGLAIRDGFLAAWFQEEASRRPTVRIYDVATQDGGSALLQAAGDGAQFVVGPLLKDEVAAATEMADGRLPVLALNFLPEESVAPRGFFQFALSPEDEARLAARRVIADGHRRGVALTPTGDWATRVLNAFAEELSRHGGTLAARGHYDPQESDHSPAIQQLFRLGDSRERHQKLTSLLGTRLHFEPRRRGDVQFIFVAAQPSQGRAIRPQLKFHYAGGVPMYATSEIYAADEAANIDLDGVTIPLMPWTLPQPAQKADTSSARALLERTWPSRMQHRADLYAFGYDAWRLVPELIARSQQGLSPTNDMIDGVTGRLYLDAAGRIHRDLDFVRIRNGRAIPLGP